MAPVRKKAEKSLKRLHCVRSEVFQKKSHACRMPFRWKLFKCVRSRDGRTGSNGKMIVKTNTQTQKQSKMFGTNQSCLKNALKNYQTTRFRLVLSRSRNVASNKIFHLEWCLIALLWLAKRIFVMDRMRQEREQTEHFLCDQILYWIHLVSTVNSQVRFEQIKHSQDSCATKQMRLAFNLQSIFDIENETKKKTKTHTHTSKTRKETWSTVLSSTH